MHAECQETIATRQECNVQEAENFWQQHEKALRTQSEKLLTVARCNRKFKSMKSDHLQSV